MADVSGFQTGMFKRYSRYWSNREIMCSCGNSFDYKGNSPICDSCGNEFFKEVNKFPVKRTLIDSMIETISKDDKSFHVRKTEVLAHIDNGKIIKLEAKKQMDMKYSLIAGEIELYLGSEKIESTMENLEAFSHNIHNMKEFILAISTKKTHDLFNHVIRETSKQNSERRHRVHRGIVSLSENPWMETLNSLGFSPSEIWFTRNNIAKNETKPNKMLGISKYMLQYLIKMGDLNYYVREDLKKLDEKLTGTNVKTMLQILDEEANLRDFRELKTDFLDLYDNYNYKDVKRLTLYLAREVKLQQGIERPSSAITVLRDYARMCVDMEIEYEKYPKSLKKDHDIVMMNYRTKKDEVKKKKFLAVVDKDDYKKLQFKSKDYSVIVPDEPQDVINEGESLSHCVASYVNDIIKEKCKILFVRPTKETDKPFLTVEVRDNKYIRQIRGKNNRHATEVEMDFINTWAKKQELEVSNY